MTVTYVRSRPEKLTEALGILRSLNTQALGPAIVTDELRGFGDDNVEQLLGHARLMSRMCEVRIRPSQPKPRIQRCPWCDSPLNAATNGVVCSRQECDYWFCH